MRLLVAILFATLVAVPPPPPLEHPPVGAFAASARVQAARTPATGQGDQT